MTELERYGRPDGDAERRAYAAIVAQAFAGERRVFEGWVQEFGDSVRLLRGDEVQAGLVVYEMGQYFGGVSVPVWGIAGVGVKAELRSKGYAAELMLANLRENYESGPALSALYPAAPRLYRNLGWEYAGARTMYGVNLADLSANGGGLELREATPDDQQVFEKLYAQRHTHENGCLDRNEMIWARVRRVSPETPLFSYIAERDGEPEGYVMYTQRRQSADTFRYNLIVRDLVCCTPEATSAILALFARHRSVADRVQFYAAPDDPIVLQTARNAELNQEQRQQWMLRVVRVKDALEQRGYSSHVQAIATVSIIDEALPDNAGPWTLTLTDGRMSVAKGGKGGAKLNVRGLAALYSGSLAPHQLRLMGLMVGSAKHDAALTAMFAGTAPWMPDFF